MLQYRAQRGAVIAWRQSEEVPDTGAGTVRPRRGWVLYARGIGRAQISYRRPGGAVSSSVSLAATGASGTFSGTANSEISVALAATGESGTFSGSAGFEGASMGAIGGSGTFSGSAYIAGTAAMDAAGDSGAFNGSAVGAEGGGGKKRKRRPTMAGTPYTHDDYVQWVVRTVAAVVASGALDA